MKSQNTHSTEEEKKEKQQPKNRALLSNPTAVHSGRSKLILCSKCALIFCTTGKGDRFLTEQQWLHSNTVTTIQKQVLWRIIIPW